MRAGCRVNRTTAKLRMLIKIGNHTCEVHGGARQESDESCGRVSRFCSALPEVLKASTEFCATQSDDGIGARDGPVHAGWLEPGSDGDFASGLDNPGGSAQTLGVEFWVAHAVSVGLKIVETAASILGVRNLAPNRGQQTPEFSAVEFFLPPVRPLRSAWASGTVQSFSQIA